MRYIVVVSLIFLLSWSTKAQQVTVHGGFMADSVSIGEETKYYLTAKYPSKINILFPDSSANYQPFEYVTRQYFPTNSKDSISYDSVVYTLSTFEVDRKQALALAVFEFKTGDTIFYSAQGDTILISQMVAHVPDSIPADKLPLKMNTAYQKVPYRFNYPVAIIIVAGICFVALLVILIFGKRIRKHFRVKRLRKNHERFIAEYSTKLERVRGKASTELTESTLFTFKKYLEQLEGWPYTKLTTRETVAMEKDEKLGESLKQIDKAIYGHEAPVFEPLKGLQEYAEKKYFRKLDEVKHGK